LPRDLQKKVDKLQCESGAKFDKDFIKEGGIDDHKDDIKLFGKNGQKAKDADVQAFATETLPILREHLQHAEKIKADKKLCARLHGVSIRFRSLRRSEKC
jgi:putative membrane protein